MNFNENDLWRDETKLLNLRLSKLPSAKVLLKLEFDTKDQVLFSLGDQFKEHLGGVKAFSLFSGGIIGKLKTKLGINKKNEITN